MDIGWIIAGPLLYGSAALCVAVTALKVLAYLKMPRQLRWDLYPIPHQGERGSKYQQQDFAHLPAHFSVRHEMLAMGQEMLVIKKAFDNNFKVWLGSFPLHAGLYLSGVWIALLALGGILENAGIRVEAVSDSPLIVALRWGTVAAGAAALSLGLTGSVYLLARRLTDPGLREMSDPVAYFNLVLMTLLFGTGLAAWLAVDPMFSFLRYQVAAIVVLRPAMPLHPLITWEFFWLCVFLAYLPFSRMLHFTAKYFFYHNIMWDDEAVKPGSRLEKELAGGLQRQPQWSASHFKAGASWLGQVTGNPEREGEKKREQESSH